LSDFLTTGSYTKHYTGNNSGVTQTFDNHHQQLLMHTCTVAVINIIIQPTSSHLSSYHVCCRAGGRWMARTYRQFVNSTRQK